MEPITQGSTATSMFGGAQQDDTATTTVAITEPATGMFGGAQQDDVNIITSTQEADATISAQDTSEVVAEVSPLVQSEMTDIPAPDFLHSFSDKIPEDQLSLNEVAEVSPVVPEVVAEVSPVVPEVVAEVSPVVPEVVAEVSPVVPEVVAEVSPVVPEVVAEVSPVVPEVVAEVSPVVPEVVAEVSPVVPEVVAEVSPVVPEVVAEVSPVVPEVVAEVSPTPLTILTANQEEQQIQKSQSPSTGSKTKGIETLKQAPEFKGIDIDAIIAHTDPTTTGTTITNTNASAQIPSSSAFKKMVAIGGGVFALLGVGAWVLSNMYSAGTTTDSMLQADVQQTQDTDIVDVAATGTNNDAATQDTTEQTTDTPITEDTSTQVSTTTQPSFGPNNSSDETKAPDLIEQVGEPSNALVDTVGHITALEEKVAIAETVVQDATDANEADAVKYGSFAVTKYKEIIQKLQNGEYNSNKDVEDIITKIDQFYNKAIDIMNNN